VPLGSSGRLTLQQLFFLLLLFSGIIPLTIISLLLISQNREVLETQEKTNLTRTAMSLSVELSDYFTWNRRQLAQLGSAIASAPGPSSLESRLGQPWVPRHLQEYIRQNPQVVALRLLDASGVGTTLAPSDLPDPVSDGLLKAYTEARARGGHVYSFARIPESNQPVAVIAVPAGPSADGSEPLYVEGVVRLGLLEEFFVRQAQASVSVFLISSDGRLLWSHGADPEMQRALIDSSVVRDFTIKPLNLTAQYSLYLGGTSYEMVGQVSPVAETGWGVVVHKPVAAAFAAVRQMVWNTVLSALLLVLLSMLIAIYAARHLSRPIQELVETSREIAAGNFAQRVEVTGPAAEIGQLAESFNRMSSHLESYIGQLKRAAQANRELFINSIRAFAAAIDAKDPYTRGHSERVATVSRTIARHLALKEELQHQVWVGALLHDVGKIGIDDEILSKGGILTPEEYEQMKLHTVIGADILSPIDQLRDMIPAVRWHHEAWDGTGYPDGLEGEDIPLIARVVAVADSFDAMTVSRPYQRFRPMEEAVRMILNLVGRRFDEAVVEAFLAACEKGEIRVQQRAVEGIRANTVA
jgi:putative nucleotidyltransferase with HDIG domain